MNLLAKGRRAVTRGWRSSARPACDPAEVAKVAYELFLQRGGAHGSDLNDWLKAEQIVAARQRNGRRDRPSGV